jgi:hypothetical protein
VGDDELNEHAWSLNPAKFLAAVGHLAPWVDTLSNFPNNYDLYKINRYNNFVCVELDFFYFVFVLSKSADEAWCCALWRNVPHTSCEVFVFIATGDNPVTVGCPGNKTDRFVLSDLVSELNSVMRLLWCRFFVQPGECPDEQFSIFADWGESAPLVIELTEPDLFLMLPESGQAVSRQKWLWTLMILQKRIVPHIDVMVGTRVYLPAYRLLEQGLQSIREQHRVLRKVNVQFLEKALPLSESVCTRLELHFNLCIILFDFHFLRLLNRFNFGLSLIHHHGSQFK